MNGRDMMPACARIAAADPAMADRMWNTTTDDDGRDLVDERMRGKGRVCVPRAPCASTASAALSSTAGRTRPCTAGSTMRAAGPSPD